MQAALEAGAAMRIWPTSAHSWAPHTHTLTARDGRTTTRLRGAPEVQPGCTSRSPLRQVLPTVLVRGTAHATPLRVLPPWHARCIEVADHG